MAGLKKSHTPSHTEFCSIAAYATACQKGKSVSGRMSSLNPVGLRL